MDILLASASPRRKRLLKDAGFVITVQPSNVKELIPIPMDPKETVMFLSLIKALDVRKINQEFTGLIVSSDTVVVNDNKILGKPISKDNAREMISSLAGKTHQVITGVAIIHCNTNESYLFFDVTDVKVSPLTSAQIEAFISTGEPYDKAGAYAIQGMFGKYVEEYNGDFNNVVGFPIDKFKKVLNKKDWI